MPSSPHHRRGFIGTRNRQARGHELPGLYLARAENGQSEGVGYWFWQADGVARGLIHPQVQRLGSAFGYSDRSEGSLLGV